jgi:phage terminase small subunit
LDMTEEKALKPLTKKQQVFVAEYLKCFNATEAARRAGYKGGDLLHTNASKILQSTTVQAEIAAHKEYLQVGVDEALILQGAIARGDITELLTPLGNVDVDFIRDSGKGRLVKKIKQRTITKIGKGEKDDDTEIHETEIELYPADQAQINILKIHGKFKETIDITSGGEKIKGYIGWTPSEWNKDAEKE